MQLSVKSAWNLVRVLQTLMHRCNINTNSDWQAEAHNIRVPKLLFWRRSISVFVWRYESVYDPHFLSAGNLTHYATLCCLEAPAIVSTVGVDYKAVPRVKLYPSGCKRHSCNAFPPPGRYSISWQRKHEDKYTMLATITRLCRTV